jgi:hypothetical protein
VPQLWMDVSKISWELFENNFRDNYLSEEFIERQLNELNSLIQNVRLILEYVARFMQSLRYVLHLNIKKL